MAKHNDMPELNSVKVFLTYLLTNHVTKAPLKPSCQQQLNTGSTLAPYRQPLQGSSSANRLKHLQAQHRDNFKSRVQKIKALCPAATGCLAPATALSGNSDMNGFAVDSFTCKNAWLKDKPTQFAKSIHRLPS